MTERRMRVVTWNIHMGVGRDGRRDLGRVTGEINRFEADILALQEVENLRLGPDGGSSELEQLSRATGLPAYAGPTLLRPDGDYGNAVLTSWPVRRIQRHDISVTGCEPRGVLELELELDGARLRVLATHLGLRRHERRRQLAQLAGLIDPADTRPLVLLGDLNLWNRYSLTLRPLQESFLATPRPPTFPSRWPCLPLDRILLRGVAKPRVWTFNDRTARAASDHLPLAAEFLLPR